MDNKAIIKKLKIPPNTRIIVISDIHGHHDNFKNLLGKVNFTSKDILFIVGDIIEKGPESLKTLRYVMELYEKYKVHTLMGNVDCTRVNMIKDDSEESSQQMIEYLMMMKKHYKSTFFTEMCDELNINIHSDYDIPNAKKVVREYFKKELAFLSSLPTAIETQNFILVHGGLPTNDLTKLSDYNASCLLKNDAFIERGLCFEKYVIVGHWPVTLYNDKIPQDNPIVNEKQKIIAIDGGCGTKVGGQLNAFIMPNINSNQFAFESCDGLKFGYAKTSQEKSSDSIYLKWIDGEIEIIEKGDEFSLIIHKSSGKKVDMANFFILDFGEFAHCNDYTDYCLEVNVGDKLSIIKETSKGYYIKKDGIIGWFYGDIVKGQS